MDILEKMEIKVCFKNGYALTFTVNEAGKMLRIARLADIWPMVLEVAKSYRAYTERSES
jgi:hypothetical protein